MSIVKRHDKKSYQDILKYRHAMLWITKKSVVELPNMQSFDASDINYLKSFIPAFKKASENDAEVNFVL